MKGSKKILAFFGSDIKDLNFLKRYSEKGYSLLPLDASAITLFWKSGIPYGVFDDYIDLKERGNSIESAEICEKGWFESARNEFTYDRICWPDLDHRAMHFFWADICLAHSMANCFREQCIEKLIFPECPFPSVKIGYNGSHPCKTFWKKDLPSIVSDIPSSKLFKIARYGYKKCIDTAHIIKKLNTYTCSYLPFNDKIILVINPGETFRFTEIVNSLSENFKDQFLVIALCSDPREVKKMSLQLSVPVFCEPQITNINYDLKNLFLKGYQKCLKESNDQYWKKPLEYLDTHFYYYCENRWPELAAKYESWLNFCQQAHPSVIIVSSLTDCESQIPAEAAKRSGIPTFSIPHAGVMDPDNIASSEYILYNLKTERITYKQGGIEEHRLIPCRGLLSENPYPVHTSSLSQIPSRGKILALTNPISIPDSLPETSVTDQFEEFRTLSHPPKDLKQMLEIKIKVHPGWPELDLIRMADEDLFSKVLPVDYPLRSALQWADLVIVLNMKSTAILHALQAEKPIILFYTDIKFNLKTCIWGKFADTIMPAGEIVQDSNQFWDLIRTFFMDPNMREKLQDRSRKYSREYLDDSKYPPIEEIIRETLENQKKQP